MLAYDYPVLGVFWSIFVFFLWVLWFLLLFKIIVDIFRNQESSGWVKALWLIFVIILPFLGVFIYIIVNGGAMSKRDAQQAQAQQQAFQSYVQQAAGSTSSADELAKLADLNSKGVITDAEFAAQKAKLLS